MATAQSVMNQAIQRSALNNPDLVPTAQMLNYISNFEKSVYATAARYNPDFFGKSASSAARADNTEDWDLSTTPGDVFALSSAFVGSVTGTVTGVDVGDEIRLVGYRWQELEIAPRAYIRGYKITQVGDELGDSASDFVDTLTLFYSEKPSAVTTLSQTLSLGDEWIDLVVLPLARILAIRDHRPEEVPALDAEYDSLMGTFIDHVSVFGHGATRPLIAVPAASGTKPPAGAPVPEGGARYFGR